MTPTPSPVRLLPLRGLLPLFGVAVLLAACGGDEPAPGTETSPAAEPSAAEAPSTPPSAPALEGATPLRRGEGQGPLAVGDPLAWLEAEQRSPAPEVAAIAARVAEAEDLAAEDLAAEDVAAQITALDEWLAAHPDDVDARYWRGRAKLLQAVPDPGADDEARSAAAAALAAAVEDLEAAVAAEPGFQGARQFLSDAYVRSDRPADALAQLDALIEARPEVGILYGNRAFLRRKTGDGPGSARDIIKACDLGYVRACIGARMEKQRLEAWEAEQQGSPPDLDEGPGSADGSSEGAEPSAPSSPDPEQPE